MHRFGGVYADLDTWAMRSLENLTESMRECRGEEAVVAMMSEDVDFEHNIPNAWMASSPGHQFWPFLVQVVQERFKQAVKMKEEHDKKLKERSENEQEENEDGGGEEEEEEDEDDVGAEVATGPVVLKEAYDTWKCMLSEEEARVKTMPAGYVFVSDWHDEDAREFFDFVCNDTYINLPKVQRQCQRAYSNAHVITFWSHSWEVPWWEKEGQDASKKGAGRRRRRGRGRQRRQQGK
jgi:hypothetical protein